mmetsp:Transcript_9978/g.20236  ORF Transcript_9978/g.20236 Transcript_9978/m.20236 type:complete len:92 (-) Transcript_9978:819-1094(-)
MVLLAQYFIHTGLKGKCSALGNCARLCKSKQDESAEEPERKDRWGKAQNNRSRKINSHKGAHQEPTNHINNELEPYAARKAVMGIRVAHCE